MRRTTPVLLLSVVHGMVMAACAGEGNNPSSGSSTATVSSSERRPGVLVATAAPSPAPAPSTTSAPVFQCPGLGAPSVTFGPTVPPDLLNFGTQSNADCFAWSELVSLNWPTGTGTFGAPMDTSPVAWETYMASDLVFPSDGSKPPAWGTEPSIPSGCPTTAPAPGGGRPRAMRPFKRVGKVSPAAAKATKAAAERFKLAAPSATSTGTVTPFGPNDIALATSPPNWLGAQNGTNVWFEVRVNQDEYNTVVNDGLYNSNQQAAFVAAGHPVVMPKGCSTSAGESCPNGSVTGAIEVKAAWMEAPDANDPAQKAKWSRYKLTDGVVVDPGTGQCRATTLALVGLHILHKTTSQPTWAWATFEQVDNAPAVGSTGTPPYGYNFNNPSCAAKQMTVDASCVPGSTAGAGQNVSVTVGCTPNTKPPYDLGPGCPGPVPIQVTRSIQLDSTAESLNQQMQAFIGQNYPGSVWQYYRLINVLWSSSPTQDPTSPIPPPQTPAGMTSGGGTKVFNTVLETYMQDNTCTDCHRYASTTNGSTFSDFSFLVGNAGPTSTTATPKSTTTPIAPKPGK
ncbi:MAG: hypothetical protein U0441_08765 [Polyangiaceae bacterium]